MPLDGRALIEASAGTGKTWSIGMLYLRLLLETGLGVERILVTTFTVAAAQELRERLRRRLAEAEHWLQCPPGALERAAEVSALGAFLVAHRIDEERAALALRRIRLARADIDRAPIATIHALCQRIGRDHPLESGTGFGDERLVADEDLRCECVEDFWRRRYLDAEVDADEEALFRDGPEGLLRDLGTIAASGDQWDEPDGIAAFQRRLAALRTKANIDRLRALASDRALYAGQNRALSGRLKDVADAFTAAVRIPNLLQNLFGEGALSGSFIPVYAALVARKQERVASDVAGAIAAILGLVTAMLVLVGVLATPLLISLIAPGFEGDKRELTITLVRILFPGTGLLVMSAWCLGILNSHHKFLLSYTAPVLWNVAMIATLLLFHGQTLPQLAITLAWGSVIGSALQFAVQLPTVMRSLGRFRPWWHCSRERCYQNRGPHRL